MHFENNPEDEELVRRFARGEVDAFARLVGRYQGAVYRFFLRMTGRGPDAEDLAQETFVRVYESLSGLEDPGRFRSWFWAIREQPGPRPPQVPPAPAAPVDRGGHRSRP